MVHQRVNNSLQKTAPFVGSWKCNVCEEKFVNPKAHVDHMRTHSLEYPSSCPLCLCRYKNSTDLGNHDCAATNKPRSSGNRTNPSAISEPLKPKQSQKTTTSSPPVQLSVPTVLVAHSSDSTSAKENLTAPASRESPSFDDGLDEEAIFEAAQNPILRRYRSSSFEANNNLSDSGKDFFVSDPWQAITALVSNSSEDDDTEGICAKETMAISGEQEEKQAPVPKPQQSVDEFIEELINPTLTDVESTKRTRARNRNRNTLRNRNITTESATKRQPKTASSTVVSNEVLMHDQILTAVENQLPSSVNSIPSTNTVEVIPASKALRLTATATATRRLSLSVPTQDTPKEMDTGEDMESNCESASKPENIPFPVHKKLSCIKCEVDFIDYESWVTHLNKKHIEVEKPPSVKLDRLLLSESDITEFTFKVRTDQHGVISVTAKKRLKTGEPSSKSNSPTQSVKTPEEPPVENNNEQRKEGLKLTLCRSAGTYVLKRKSTDSEPEQTSSRNVQRDKAIVSEPVIPVPQLPVCNETQEAVSQTNADIVLPQVPVCNSVVPETVPQTNAEAPLVQAPGAVRVETVAATGESRSSSVAVSNRPRFKPRFINAVHSVMRHKKTELSKKTAEQSPSKPTEVNESGSKTSMTSSSASSETNSQNKEVRIRHASGSREKTTTTATTPVPPQEAATQAAPSSEKTGTVHASREENDNQSTKSMPDLSESTKTTESNKESNDTVSNNEGNKDGPPREISILPDDGPEEGESEEVGASESQRRVTNTSVIVERGSERSNKDAEMIVADKDAKDETQDQGRKNGEDEDDDDFKCRICYQMFSNDAELQQHFNDEHLRTVVASSILETEPESPFPTVTVPGRSAIFEDEVEESIPFPVETELVELPMSSQLSDLLRRDSGEDDGHVMEPSSIIGNRPLAIPYGGIRPPMAGRPHMPHIRPMPMMHADESMRPGMRQPFAPGMQGHRGPLPPGFPATLHQALVGRQNMSDQPPPRPQLRPMPTVQVRTIMPGAPPQLQNRPPLLRGMTQPHSQSNPQSILRNSQPPPQQPQQPSPPDIDRQRQVRVQQLQFSIRQVQQEMQQIGEKIRRETDPYYISCLNNKKDKLLEMHGNLQKQLQQIQQQQQIQHNQQMQYQQQLLHRQQLHQQQQHNQQLRQQLQQQHQQAVRHIQPRENNNPALINANGKRPSVEMTESPQAKQARLENQHLAQVSEQQRNDNLSLRIPQGISLSVVQQQQQQQQQQQPPTPPHNAIHVPPGMSSGGSNSSRHSSGTVSPAAGPGPNNPGVLAARLASSGITLAPASPLAVTPPENPIRSPISEGTLSPRTVSPRIPNTVIQRAPHIVSPGAAPQISPIAHHEGGFAMPRAPAAAARTSVEGPSILTNPNAERPDRPPTIDLTDDEVQAHNNQMRATGGGAVTQDQIRFHEARRGMQNIPGTSQFTIRPVQPQQQQQPRAIPCPNCPALFTSIDLMNDHRLKIHGLPPSQNPYLSQIQNAHQQNIRQPQVAVRRPSPPLTNMPNISSIHGHRLDAPPLGPNRGGSIPVVRPPAPQPPQLTQVRSTQPRPPERSPISTGEGEKLVIPLLNLSRLDQYKIRALNEIGVASFIPLQGITRLGIPILRLLPDTAIGHFPHDTAIEVGPLQRFSESESIRGPNGGGGGNNNPNRNVNSIVGHGSVPRPPVRTPPGTNVPNHGVAPPHHIHPPSVVSPPMGTVCTDRNCPDVMRRPSPSGVVHHAGNHHPGTHPNSNHNQSVSLQIHRDSLAGRLIHSVQRGQ